VAQLAPAVVLVMGRAAVRHCLGRSEPLGQLRGQSFTLAGVPAVVTFDAPVLLRSPGLKPAAWEDLCRARALAAATA
jgi:DNA polymerase